MVLLMVIENLTKREKSQADAEIRHEHAASWAARPIHLGRTRKGLRARPQIRSGSDPRAPPRSGTGVPTFCDPTTQ